MPYVPSRCECRIEVALDSYFLDDWLPYDDAGTHHLESRFERLCRAVACRVRLREFLWRDNNP